MKVWHAINTRPSKEVDDKYKKACVTIDVLNGKIMLTSGIDENGWVHVFELITENKEDKRIVKEGLKKGKLILTGLDFKRFSMYKDEEVKIVIKKIDDDLEGVGLV